MEGDLRSSSSDISDSSENARPQQINSTPKKKLHSASNSPKQLQKKKENKISASKSN